MPLKNFIPIFVLAFTLPSVSVAQSSGFDTSAPHAVILDSESDEILFQKDAVRPMPPASMTKIMTAFMIFEALESGQITMDTEFTVSEEAWRRGGAKSGSSTMFLDLNSQVRVEDLLRGVIIQSGNDACIVLAEGLAGSETAFANRMTARAHELGLKSATFLNATGWPDPGHEISALDLAKLTNLMVKKFPQYYALYSERNFTWNGISQGNRNPLLGRFAGADGLKTGHTSVSGYGLVGSAERDGTRRIMVINGTESQSDRRNTALSLMTAAFTQFKLYKVYEKGARVGDVDVYMGKSQSVPVLASEDVSVGLARINRSSLRTELHAKTVVAPVSAGDALGDIIILEGDVELKRIKAVAAEDVKAKSAFGKAWTSLLSLIRGES